MENATLETAADNQTAANSILEALCPDSVPASPRLARGDVPLIITWGDPPADTHGFRLFRDHAPVPIYDGPQTSFTDTVRAGAHHEYQLLAYNSRGEGPRVSLGRFSASPASHHVPSPLVPILPSAVHHEAETATFSWEKSPFAVSYALYRKANGHGPILLKRGVTALTYTDEARPPGRVTYFVQAEN